MSVRQSAENGVHIRTFSADKWNIFQGKELFLPAHIFINNITFYREKYLKCYVFIKKNNFLAVFQ